MNAMHHKAAHIHADPHLGGKRPPRTELDVLETPRYLLRTGILSAQDVFLGNLRIEDISRRNRNFRVVTEAGVGFLVKQAMPERENTNRNSLGREAAMLRTIHQDSIMEKVRPHAPIFVHYDRSNEILVTELIHPATSLTKLHLHYGKVEFPDDAAETAGRMLATFHLSGNRALREGRFPFLETRLSNGLSILNAGNFGSAGQVGWEYWNLVKEEPCVARLVEVTQRYKDAGTIVHGDARWDNYLLTHGQLKGGLNLRMIDWEMARTGDSTWDVACFFGDYLRFWGMMAQAAAQKKKGKDDVAGVLAEPPFPWSSFHASALVFWETYCKRMRLSAKARRESFGRLLDYLPYYCIMIGWENIKNRAEAGSDGTLDLVPRLMANLSARFAKEPRTQFKEVYGFADE